MINWGSFFLVAVVSIGASIVLSGFYAGGVRLLAVAHGPEGTGSGAPGGPGRGAPAAMVGAVVCFAVCIVAVLFGLWLVIPQFH